MGGLVPSRLMPVSLLWVAERMRALKQERQSGYLAHELYLVMHETIGWECGGYGPLIANVPNSHLDLRMGIRKAGWMYYRPSTLFRPPLAGWLSVPLRKDHSMGRRW